MSSFSQSSAVAACSALSQNAQSTAAKMQLEVSKIEGDLQTQLSTLSPRLQQFAHHAEQLGHCISDASVVHQQLGDALKSSLAECQHGLSTVADRLDTALSRSGPGQERCRDAIACCERFLAAYSTLFILGTQLLIMETEQEQQSTLANPGAENIVHAARIAGLSLGYGIKN